MNLTADVNYWPTVSDRQLSSLDMIADSAVVISEDINFRIYAIEKKKGVS